MKFVFRDLVLANIRLVGQLIALSALFTAICMSLSWLLDMTIAGSIEGSTDSVSWMFELPMAITADFATWVGFDGVAGVINTDWAGWTLGAESGEAHSWHGLIACAWAFAGVVLALAQLYVSMAIYTFLFGLGTSFMNWFKNPYLPTKSM